jgi:hypothetical protein
MYTIRHLVVSTHSILSTHEACSSILVTNGKGLLLRAQPLLDDVLAILPELSGVLDTKAVIENVLDFLQAKTRNLGVEEVWKPSLTGVICPRMMIKNLQIRTQPMPQIAA